MTSHCGELLDIGAGWGYFCHRFEELGYSCTALDESPRNLYLMTRLRDARERRFRIISTSILEEGAVEDRAYSVILALSVFHHFLKHRNTFRQFESLLPRLHAAELFMEPHLEHEPQMESAEVYMSPKALVDFVGERRQKPKVELIGRAPDGRTLYRLAHE